MTSTRQRFVYGFVVLLASLAVYQAVSTKLGAANGAQAAESTSKGRDPSI